MSRTSPLFVLTTKTYLLIFLKKLHNLASAETDLQDFFQRLASSIVQQCWVTDAHNNNTLSYIF